MFYVKSITYQVVSYGEHCHGDGTDCKDMEWIKPMLEKYKVMVLMITCQRPFPEKNSYDIPFCY